MARFAAMLSCAILAALALLHFYWAAGGGTGKAAAIPTAGARPMLHPGPLSTAAIAFILLAMAATVAARAGLLPVPGLVRVSRWATWLIAAAFALRAVGEFHYVGFFKTVVDTRFATMDTKLYSPLCLMLAGLIAWVAALAR
jgi:Protein of unknown function (DUF3995)